MNETPSSTIKLDTLRQRIAASEAAESAQLRAEAALQESQRALSTLLSNLPGMAYRCRNDPAWTMEFVSEGCVTLTGYQPSDLIQNAQVAYAHLIHPDDQGRVWQEVQAALHAHRAFQLIYRLRTATGAEKWVWEQGCQVSSPAGQGEDIEGFITDITNQKQAEAALRQSEARYRALVEGSIQGICVSQGDVIVFANPAMAAMLGYDSPDALLGYPILEIIAPQDRPRLQGYRAARLQGDPVPSRYECQALRQDGTLIWIEVVASHIEWQGRPAVLGTFLDITARKRAEAQLLHDAFHDALTGLPNHAFFLNRLERTLGQDRHLTDRGCAVLVVDIDHFRRINDAFGRSAGDHVLISVARQLETCLRPGDTLARLGEDAFAILLEGIGHACEAARIAARCQEALSRSCQLGAQEVRLTASLGLALPTCKVAQPADLLRHAEMAMYRAKDEGRARHECFDPAMQAELIERVGLEAALRQTLDHQGLQLYYQPIVSLVTGQLTGFEALLRWPHPDWGMVSPEKFIPVAEDTGLIIPLGQWVFGAACRQLQAWQSRTPVARCVTVSINLSGKQFAHPDFLASIEQVLAETGLAPEQVKLEITETALMDDPDAAAAMLAALRARQVHILLDDFGTGYSSLSYLHQFPLDGVKIDRSFVSRLDQPKHQAIVQAIVTLAHTLELRVIAEGVETETQLAQLRSLHCDYVQGYYVAKPLDADAAEALLLAPPLLSPLDTTQEVPWPPKSCKLGRYTA